MPFDSQLAINSIDSLELQSPLTHWLENLAIVPRGLALLLVEIITSRFRSNYIDHAANRGLRVAYTPFAIQP